VFGPIPGSRINASISFAIGSGTCTFRPLPLQNPVLALKQPRQIETARQFTQVFGHHLIDLFHRLVDGSGDQILQHLHILRIDHFGGDLHRLHLLVSVHPNLDHTASRRALHFLLGQLLLGLGHLGLHFFHLFHHLIHVSHVSVPSRRFLTGYRRRLPSHTPSRPIPSLQPTPPRQSPPPAGQSLPLPRFLFSKGKARIPPRPRNDRRPAIRPASS